MTTYLRNFLYYFENVFHPAGGNDETSDNRKRKAKKSGGVQSSPESINLRGAAKKMDKSRFNPAP